MYFDPIHYCQYSPQEKFSVALYHYVIARYFPFLISEAIENEQADILIAMKRSKPHPMGFRVINRPQKN